MIADNTFWAYFAGLFTGIAICGTGMLFNYLVNKNKEMLEDMESDVKGGLDE